MDLTYRTDLRELNELNHARFEANLSEGLAKLGADLKLKLGALRAELQQDIAEARAAAKNELAAVRDDLTAVRVDLAAAIAALKHDLIGVQHEVVGVRAAAKDFVEARAAARQDLADTRADLLAAPRSQPRRPRRDPFTRWHPPEMQGRPRGQRGLGPDNAGMAARKRPRFGEVSSIEDTFG